MLAQKKFSKCDLAEKQLELYKLVSDSVLLFLDEENYKQSLLIEDKKYLKDLYIEYKEFCSLNGFRPCSQRSFSDKLSVQGYSKDRLGKGYFFFMRKN